MIKEGSHIGDTYGTISDYLGSDKAASEFLHELGYTGIKVHAAHNSNDARFKDNWNYVVFNDKDLKITDKVRFFRTANGEAYGFTVGGKIYIDPRIARARRGDKDALEQLRTQNEVRVEQGLPTVEEELKEILERGRK